MSIFKQILHTAISNVADKRTEVVQDWHLLIDSYSEGSALRVKHLLSHNVQTNAIEYLFKNICDAYFKYENECIADVNFITRWAHVALLCNPDFGVHKEQLRNPCFVFNFYEDIQGQSISCYNGFTVINNKELYSILTRPIIVYGKDTNECTNMIISAVVNHYKRT